MFCYKVLTSSSASKSRNIYDLFELNANKHVASSMDAIANPFEIENIPLGKMGSSCIIVGQGNFKQITDKKMANMGFLSTCAVLVAISINRDCLDTWVYHAPFGSVDKADGFFKKTKNHRFAYIIPHEDAKGYIKDIQELVTKHEVDANNIIIIFRSCQSSDVWVSDAGDFCYAG